MKHRLPLITTASTYILIILGVLVVGFDAGLACSDWPLCNGRIMPPLEGKILVEFTHRTFSSLTGILILLNAFFLWKKYLGNKRLRVMAIAPVFLLGLVAVLGGVNVLNKLPSGLTALDMVVALLLLASLVWFTVQTRADNKIGFFGQTGADLNGLRQLYRPAVAVAVAVFMQAAIGGFLKHSSASHTYVHPEAPLPKELVTTFPAAQAVMMLHGFAVFLVVFAVFWLLVFAKKHKMFLKQSIFLVLLIVVQIALGLLAIMTKLELLTTTAHMAVASLMLWISVDIASTVKLGLTAAPEAVSYERKFRDGQTVISNG
jgi:cytochrome c oxidase assembly protein subunit 15